MHTFDSFTLGEKKMNRGVKMIILFLSIFMIFLVLNVVDQANTPLVGDWTTITTNFINILPYLMLIFSGIYYVSRR
jgi:hypothetical protein